MRGEPDEALVRHIIALLRERVEAAMGKAMAAVLHGKPEGAVTDEEARAALADWVKPGDAETTHRAFRAGLRTMAMKFEGDLIPSNIAGEIVGVATALDRGEARGFAIPGVSQRWQGASRRDELAVFIAAETHYRRALEDLSVEEALARVTGIRRPGARRPVPSPDTLSADLRMLTYDQVRDLYRAGVKLLGPDGINDAEAQGVAASEGTPVNPDFNDHRKGWLALARNGKAWRAMLRKAGLA